MERNPDSGRWESTTCAECSKHHKKCKREEYEYRATCERCETNKLECSLSNDPVRFYATDFYFRHEPEGHEAKTEKQPGGRDRDEMQYIYQEWPYESSKPWSALYVRQQLNDKGVSPFRYTPIIYVDRPIELDATNILNVQMCWDQHHTRPGIKRPEFAKSEKVLTCRRICSLNGFLEVSVPKPSSFVPFSIRPGLYQVRWRLQFFSVPPTAVDRESTFDREQKYWTTESEIGKSAPCNSRGHRNPLGFPQWEDSRPDFSTAPVLQLSVGYKSILQRVSDYFETGIKKGFKREQQLSDQVLRPADAPGVDSSIAGFIRQDKDLESGDFHKLRDKGWLYVDADGPFRVIQEQHVTFIVCNYDNGEWQGGFRFGGVELVRIGD